MNENGNISFAFILIIIGVVVTFMFIVIAPAMQSYLTKVYAAGEPLIEDANSNAQTFGDSNVKNLMTGTLQDQKDSVSLQIEVLGLFYKFGWLFVLVISAILLLLFSRFLVERNAGGAV